MAAGHGLARGASAGAQRRRQPADGSGASFIYALLSKNAVNRGFLHFIKSMKFCQVLATKRL